MDVNTSRRGTRLVVAIDARTTKESMVIGVIENGIMSPTPPQQHLAMMVVIIFPSYKVVSSVWAVLVDISIVIIA